MVSISSYEISEAVKCLLEDKSDGLDNLNSEHCKHAGNKLCVLLSLIFNSMWLHGHILARLTETILVPIAKDNKGDIAVIMQITTI